MNVQNTIVVNSNLTTVNQNLDGNRFGHTADGRPGWKDGADTVHPFMAEPKLIDDGKTIPAGCTKAYIVAINLSTWLQNEMYVSGSIIVSQKQLGTTSGAINNIAGAVTRLHELTLSGAAGTISISFQGGTGTVVDKYMLFCL